jgi:two-component system, OmpR family, phosphate regulon sensor histidine kinase PhoR
MTAAMAALAVALVIAVLLLGRAERGRRRALAAAGASGGDLAEAIERRIRGTAPRAELSEAMALRDALMAAAPSPVLVFDEDGRLLRANALARREAPTLLDLEAQPELEAGVRSALEGGMSGREIELTVYEPGRRRYRVHIRPFRGETGRRCVVMLEDESAEADYRDARRLFSAGVSHELRTPLQRILGLVETLGLELTDDARGEIIAQARREVDGMRRLIEDMIMLVQLESHGVDPVTEPTDMAEAAQACVDRHAEAAADASMPLTVSANLGLVAAVPPRLVEAVLDNLVENAIRHAGPGAHVEVRVRGLSGSVELVVHDTGGRIPPEHLGRVFERFHRVENARSGPGTGLGLAIVKHIAEEYGGRATAESSPEAGTTMRVVLPAPATVRDG